MILGIDFGTTRTVVAAETGGRFPVAAFDIRGAFVDYVPGLARRTEHGVAFGWGAKGEDPQGLLRSVKRVVADLAPDDPVPGFDGLSALELLTQFLGSLKEDLVRRSNLGAHPGEPLQAMVAVPANASSQQRYTTLEAFRRAGFDVLGVVNEPTAAAIDLAHQELSLLNPRSPKRYVVVYDLGGGTFDTAAVSLDGRRFDLLDTEGLRHMGGDDFDALLLDLALEALGGPSVPEPLLSAALEICRDAKETMRSATRRLLVDLTALLPDTEPVAVDAAVLFERAAPLVDETLELVDAVFQRIRTFSLDPDDPRTLGGIYLVGGAAQFPPVLRGLRQRYGRKIRLASQPHAATAIGLAVAASPDERIFVRETTTRHFGVWREAEQGQRKIFDPIFSKGERPGPDNQLTVTRAYRPTHSIGHLRFLECTRLDDHGPAGDITPCGELFFPYDPALANRASLAGVPATRRGDLLGEEICESYTYLADGTVRVDVENRTHGYRRSCVVGE